MKKRLIVCCDGTWQKLTSPYPTNVVKITQAIKPSCSKGISQIVYYDEGVGSGNIAGKLLAKADKILGGAFGIGIDNNIEDAYRFLSLNYEPGDQIYLFGFSRGAYTVRSLAGLIRSAGGLLSLQNMREVNFVYELYRDRTLTLEEKALFRKLPIPYEYKEDKDKIKECRNKAHEIYSDRTQFSLEEVQGRRTNNPKADKDLTQKQQKVQQLLEAYGLKERDDDKIRQKVPKITCLGCWDTVGSLGVPRIIPFLSNWINKKYAFYDYELSSIIQYAIHAVSIDEIRQVFDVTPMQRNEDDEQPLHQVWFPGAHGCIGGGDVQERSLSDAALEWMMDRIEHPESGYKLGLEFDRNQIEDPLKPEHKHPFNNRPKIFYRILGVIDRKIPPEMKVASQDKILDLLHESTKKRWRDCPDYRPNSLKKYEQELNSWCQNNH